MASSQSEPWEEELVLSQAYFLIREHGNEHNPQVHYFLIPCLSVLSNSLRNLS